MKSYTKKLIAPIVITILVVIYFIGFIVLWNSIYISSLIKVIGIIVPLLFIGVSIYVLVERIKEIRSGEEDDLGKY